MANKQGGVLQVKTLKTDTAVGRSPDVTVVDEDLGFNNHSFPLYSLRGNAQPSKKSASQQSAYLC